MLPISLHRSSNELVWEEGSSSSGDLGSHVSLLSVLIFGNTDLFVLQGPSSADLKRNGGSHNL